MNNIAMSLKYERELKGLSQKGLADKMGVSAALIHNYEKGVISPTAKNVERICKALGIAPNRLYSVTENEMTGNLYQKLAARTINSALIDKEKEMHALHGLVGEIGELHSLYQKVYQGHNVDETHAKKELGDLLWFVAEYCTAKHWDLDEIMQLNIDKLKARFPEGFEVDKSLHRKEGDI